MNNCLPSHWANQTTSLSLSFSFWVWPEFWGGWCEWCADPAPRAVGRPGLCRAGRGGDTWWGSRLA